MSFLLFSSPLLVPVTAVGRLVKDGKIKSIEEKIASMEKNMKVKQQNFTDSKTVIANTVEKKESELKTMLSTVLGDKSKIEETIRELDRYKRDALHTTW